VRGNPERVDVIGFHGSFHGRTYAALNAAGNASYLDGLGPLMDGFKHVAFTDRNAWEELIASPTTAAVIVEPVQGEGGARAFDLGDLEHLRAICTRHGVLLIYDEVQSGMGRTGRLFAHQWATGAEPDIMAIAKALGAGFPVSACLATEAAAIGMTVGTHGSTFGGNPLAMAVAIAAFDEISKEETLAAARARSEQLRSGLAEIAGRYPQIVREIRGRGLLIGVQMVVENKKFVALAREQNLLIMGGGDNVVRLLPALTITEEDAREVLVRFERSCAKAADVLLESGAQVVA
jgi:acetylornithine/N-succinyldiaminopimelate aminotransferase